jgi:1,4-alpha-glucan branching enzyme
VVPAVNSFAGCGGGRPAPSSPHRGAGVPVGRIPPRRGRFLDLLGRLDHLRELGVNAIQPLPIQEFPSEFSKGYNGTDYFSPETDYQVTDAGELAAYLDTANALLARHGRGPLALDDVRTGPNQLKLVVDLCHLEGIAVILDVVYNHAGGGFDDASLYFFDRQHRGDLPDDDYRDHVYFSPWGWAGGVVFDFRDPGVRRFLIDNARFLLDEFRVDGFRYDEVSVCANHQGWAFCQELADAVRRHRPEAIQIAEYWNDWRWQAVVPPPHGMGFDAAPSDVLRRAVRGALAQAAWGARVDMGAVAGALHPPHGFPDAWRAVQSVEDHDVVYAGREARVAALADHGNARSWAARSRSRVATGLVLTAPGIPMLFMGQEVLEDKNWSDNPQWAPETLVWWEGVETDRAMRDHLRFTRDLAALRHRLPALRGEPLRVLHVHDDDRVIAVHRWLEGTGRDVLVVASLNDATFWCPPPRRSREPAGRGAVPCPVNPSRSLAPVQ